MHTGSATVEVEVVDPHGATTPAWLAFDTGPTHTCAIRADGRTYCWGSSAGLGNGADVPRYTPTIVAGAHVFVDVSVGLGFSCGSTATETFCWGDDSSGELGDGIPLSGGGPAQRVPRPIVGGVLLPKVAAGVAHACGLSSDGAAYCWGLQLYGELGDGVIPTKNQYVSTPTKVLGGHSFTAIAAGSQHSCALTGSDGSVWCWGQNGDGRLGDLSKTTRAQPVRAGDATFVFSRITAGGDFTCALTTDQKGWCWGAGTHVGDPLAKADTVTAPHAISGGLKFTDISAGDTHACAIATDGKAYCWGSNDYGELGIGSSGSGTTVFSPTLVSGGLSFKSIRAGTRFTCAITTSEQAYCWGKNYFGAGGDGGKTDHTTPQAVLTF